MDYFMEWSEWLEIVDNLPKADKIVLDRIDTELEKEECQRLYCFGKI